MAQITINRDDIDGTPGLEGIVVEEHTIKLDDREVKVHLTEQRFLDLEEMLAVFFQAGRSVKPEKAVRRTPKLSRPSEPVKAPTASNGASNGAAWYNVASQVGAADVGNDVIRDWARSQGIDVNPKGRLSGAVKELYLAAHNNGGAPAELAAEVPTETPPARRAKAPRTARTITSKRGPRGKERPSDQELVDLARQAGDGMEFARELGVKTTTTARKWLADARRRIEEAAPIE